MLGGASGLNNGVFGIFSLDGAPINPRDQAMLLGDLEDTAIFVPGARIAVRDLSGAAVHVHRSETGIAMLLGDLDEIDTVAARLAMPRDGNVAALAAAAFERWGHDAPSALAGQWLLLRWHAPSGTLTLLMAECAYESCHVATDGRRVAIAPDLVRLARLPWVDSAFDPDMLMRAMGRSYLRGSMGARSIVKGIIRVRAGACVTVRRDSLRTALADSPSAPPCVGIGFEDAVAGIDILLRRIVRQRLARAGDVAIQTSGGLDSSLMGVLAAQERKSGQQLHCLTSVASAGSGVADESGWADTVARHLDIPLIRVTPAADADPYRPSARMFAAAPSPSASPWHYLYEALGDAAADAGASLLMDGAFGEMTISSHGTSLASQQRRPTRATARALQERWRSRFATARTEDYHVMPARAAIASLDDLRALRPRATAPRRLADDDAFGFEDGGDRIGQQATFVGDARVRTLLPLRDPRLIRLMASYPAGLVRHRGVDRALIRALLRGHLPEPVVIRTKGSAFSPMHDTMLYAHADAALGRLDEQKRAGADQWLDLTLLERALMRVRERHPFSLRMLVRIQATAYAAEFFSWWRQLVP